MCLCPAENTTFKPQTNSPEGRSPGPFFLFPAPQKIPVKPFSALKDAAYRVHFTVFCGIQLFPPRPESLVLLAAFMAVFVPFRAVFAWCVHSSLLLQIDCFCFRRWALAMYFFAHLTQRRLVQNMCLCRSLSWTPAAEPVRRLWSDFRILFAAFRFIILRRTHGAYFIPQGRKSKTKR